MDWAKGLAIALFFPYKVAMEKDAILLLMRHGESPTTPKLLDIERPLSERGIKQCQSIGSQIVALAIKIDQAVISSALRTRQTFLNVNQTLKLSQDPVIEPTLFHGEIDAISEIIAHHFMSRTCMLVIGHNPWVSELTGILTRQFHQLSPAEVIICRALRALDEPIFTPGSFSFEGILRPRVDHA
jgi:phosphohistidine phosphatase SixA